ncbi:(E)-beta-farnesene synthase [Melia azedarach]|uniref:(E)-beta-farnesene synthase n=1 Tax=Melia azedarach TaxID=155640 RepID=A0ACC1XPN5_MELAZ|nr:(E)-beta-farnesene synthase [Melia azedarach]
MSTQVPAVVSCTNEETVRPIADFHPSLWGNQFITGASNFKSAIDATTREQHEALKQEIRRMITATTENPAEKLQLIDEIQRLDVSYHFEKEIEDVLEEVSRDLDCDSDDLYTTSLRFRLLRQQGIKISVWYVILL